MLTLLNEGFSISRGGYTIYKRDNLYIVSRPIYWLSAIIDHDEKDYDSYESALKEFENGSRKRHL